MFALALPPKASLVLTTRDYRVGLSHTVVPHGVPIAVTVRNAGKHLVRRPAGVDKIACHVPGHYTAAT